MRVGGPAIALSMLAPLLIMATGFGLLFAALLMLRMRTSLNERRAMALRLNAGPEPMPRPGPEPAITAQTAAPR
jgi:heme exporter protein C